jgi:ribosomal peptide maturation radical SAM protein 1
MRVLLVSMPCVAVVRPAIGVSLLKSILRDEGIECRVAYGNLRFAARVGLDAYEIVNDRLITGAFAGDWLFAQHLFGGAVDPHGYAAKLRGFAGSEEAYEAVMRMRAVVPAFLDECMEAFDIARYDIVGFTTTFEQNLASLSLARMVKERFPEKVVVFGGANCDGVMGVEMHRSFPWIDYVVGGEADLIFPTLVKHLACGGAVPLLAGVTARVQGASRPGPPAIPVQDMDALPVPDYDDYFDALASMPFFGEFQPMIPFESARGCWWGAKNHCTFCGLNAESMSFRAKSASRVLAEIEAQKERYGLRRFMAVDNILPHEYFKTLLPELKQRNLGVTLFYEIKANLKRPQVELLRDAGVTALQPGIESLSTQVLRLMRKGTTGLQNVYMLKLAREYGIHVVWNLLYGFPGERPEDYVETPRMLEAIAHLAPPASVSPIRLDRFSPNFNHASELGFVNVRPFGTYQHLYPLPPERIANLAYFFRYDRDDGRRCETYMADTIEQVRKWKGTKGGELSIENGDEGELILVDTRLEQPPRRVRLTGLESELYELCADPRSRNTLMAHAAARWRGSGDAAGTPEQIDVWVNGFLARMTDERLMLREGDHYLSLAIDPTLDPRANRAAIVAALAALS